LIDAHTHTAESRWWRYLMGGWLLLLWLVPLFGPSSLKTSSNQTAIEELRKQIFHFKDILLDQAKNDLW
jgi:hypothetical protein